jgi:hypothetical protein
MIAGQDESFATFELELLDPRKYRSAQAEETWQTARRKSNRIALGRPRWRHETAPSSDGMLTASDLQHDSPDSANFWAVSLDLTLLPDNGCRFRSAQLSLTFEGAPEIPNVRRLRPTETSEQQAVTTKSSGALHVSVKGLPYTGAELGVDHTDTHEVTQTLVRLASFGASTHQAGWRLQLTNAREIPLNSTDLDALIVSPKGFTGQVVYSVIAEIEIRTIADRWLTAIFGPKRDQPLRSSEPFPPIISTP